MREILVYDDYEIHKLGAGGGTEYEEITTEKATSIYVTDVAKTKGKLLPFGRTTQKQLSGKNLFNINGLDINAGDVQKTIIENRIVDLEAIGTKGAQFVGEVIELDSTKNYTFSCKAKKIVCEPTGYSMIRAYLAGSNDGETYTRISYLDKNSPTVNTEYSLSGSFTGYSYLRIYLYNRAESTVVIGEKTQYYDIQLEEGDVVTDYELFCGGQASPNPGYQQEIENVDGRSCRNLFGKELFDENLWDITGTDDEFSIQPKNAGTTSQNISYDMQSSVFSGTIDYTNLNGSIVFKNGDNVVRNVLYKFDNSSGSTSLFQLASNNYIDTLRIVVYSKNSIITFKKCQLNEGSTALPYEPYFEGKRLDFNVCNKNIFDNEWELGIIRGDTGVNQDNSSYIRSKNFIPVKELTNYKISDKNNIFNRMLVYEYKSDFSYNLTTNKNVYNYFTTEKDTAYIRIRPGVEMTDTSVKVQIEEGTTATSYEEHKEQMIPFPLAENQKLMEGDYLADDGIHHTKGQVTFDGTESWSKDSTNKLVGTEISGGKINPSVTQIPYGKCNRYIVSNLNDAMENTYKFAFFGSSTCKVWLNAQGKSVADYKTWLSTNNVTVEYELAQETIEPYTTAQAEAYSKLKNLILYKGANHIWTETDGLEPNLQLTYKRKKQSNVLQVSSIQPLNNLELNNTEETPEEITTEISEE